MRRASPECASGQRDVAGREDPRRAGFEKLVDRDAAIDLQAGPLGKVDARPHADADDDEISRELCAAFERDLIAFDCRGRVIEVKHDAMVLVQSANEVAEFRTEHALKRPALRRHHMDLDLARPQRGRDLEADEARADHHSAARMLGAVDDGARIGE